MSGQNDERDRYEDYADERSVLHTDDRIEKRPDSRPDSRSVFTERRGRPKRGEVRLDWAVEPSND